MQDDPKVDIQVHEDEIAEPQDVDAKLISLAKVIDAKICTTDFNLNNIASLQGVEVLNVHELANAVKSDVNPSEEIEIKLVKEGKESDQAIGYLEDGTMVVVSEGKAFIGETVKVSVTSLLQTSAGRMIFAKIEK